ncbi:hypothetical protein [Bradyrhizobium sp. RDM4]|uniref:hypothetical protein n=1 Tax=Bradyrhizobium sp. RDM4 TaxID=3378765 RepID=UPI0038FD2280
MVDERRGRAAAVPSTATIVAKYNQLSPEDQATVTAKIKRILAERDQSSVVNEPTGSATSNG